MDDEVFQLIVSITGFIFVGVLVIMSIVARSNVARIVYIILTILLFLIVWGYVKDHHVGELHTDGVIYP